MAEWAVNPLFLFLAVWGSATGLYLAGVSAGIFPRGTPGALWAVFLNVVTFSLGYLTWTVLCRLQPEKDDMQVSAGVPLTAERLRT